MTRALSALLSAALLLAACVGVRDRAKPEDLKDEPKRTLREAYELTEATAPDSSVRLLADNVDAWVTRWALISGANERIDTTYFIVEPDVFGMSLVGLLLRKAQQGVKVRLMVDSRGTFSMSRGVGADVLQELLATGNAEVRVYNPMESQIAEAVARLDFKHAIASNHDKMILVDGDRAIMGGRNISRDYLADPLDHGKAFVDVDMLVTGQAAAAHLLRAFEDEYHGPRTRPLRKDVVDLADKEGPLNLMTRAMEIWLGSRAMEEDRIAVETDELRGARSLWLQEEVKAALPRPASKAALEALKGAAEELVRYPRLRGELDKVREAAQTADVRVLDSHSTAGVGKNDINAQVVRMVEAAQREVVVQNPYVVLSDYGLEVLKRASERGVEIIVLTNSPTSSDSAVTQALFLRAWKHIMAEVPTMRIFVLGGHHLLHSKVGVFDGQVTMLGSYNLDYLSAYVNSEVVASVWSKEFAAENRAAIMKHVEKSAPEVFEYKIARDEFGAVMRGSDGEIVAEFGPENHCSKEELDAIRKIQTVLEPARLLPDLAPLL
jgi:phosphatidylserine/phosphatidylglycerophosphate/cardiolipin synthase-like enzyme